MLPCYVFSASKEFPYQLLSRCKSDCLYYLGAGNRQEKYLWGQDVATHMQTMKEIWQRLTEKPEWCSWEEIEKLEAEMLV